MSEENKKSGGCGCGKKKQQTEPDQQQFRTTSTEKGEETTIKKKLTMVQSFSSAIASRGLSDKKVSKFEKQLRVLSCFGNAHTGGQLPPCEHLKKSKTEGKYFCGGCGCGDRKQTWLLADGDEYSKLDYPKLHCPLKMPGFSNYEKSAEDEAIAPITRRYYVENMNTETIEQVSVTTPEQPVEIAKNDQKVEEQKQ